MEKRYSKDLTKGSVLKQLLIFTLPILLANILQQFYHSADVIVVGNFARDSKIALAAVGSTGTVTNLLINMFIGLSLGVNVVCANFYGAQDMKNYGKAVETGLIVAALSGVFISVCGFFLARPILAAMDLPETVLDHAVTYMKIIFLGQPGSLIYNFGSGILRARGDTKRPMYILSVAGVINVVLNLFFVVVFHLDSAGVALATTVSHYVSAAFILAVLCHTENERRLNLLRLRFDRKIFSRIMKIGIPGGLNGMVFSISNLTIAKGIYSLGDTVIAANSAAGSIDGFTYQILVSFYTATISFAGQNYGAKNLKRIDRLLWQSVAVTTAIYLFVFAFIAVFPRFFLGLFTRDAEVITAAVPRLYVMGLGYFIYILSDMSIGCLRGMGKSVVPTVLNAVMICVPRLLWTSFVFPLHPTFSFLYLCYPISYVFSSASQLICYFGYRKKEQKKLDSEKAAAASEAEPTEQIF